MYSNNLTIILCFHYVVSHTKKKEEVTKLEVDLEGD